MPENTTTTNPDAVAVPTDAQAKAIHDLISAGYGHVGEAMQPGYNPHQHRFTARLEMLAAAGLIDTAESGKLRRYTFTQRALDAYRAWNTRRTENPTNRGSLPRWAQ